MVGLLGLMIAPAPGVWGILIGAACCLAIALCALVWGLDRLAARILVAGRRMHQKRRRRRGPVHTGSRIAKKVAKPTARAPASARLS